jgi:serine/threonine-protein kinase SRPK3
MDESEREDVQKYVPGGFHPVDIGDKIAQYTVLHKLGSGGFATVWLVQSSEDNHYYALKILCAASTSDSKSNEQEVLEHLGQHDHPSVTKLLHAFKVTGPNGVHTCLVLPVCGPSLYNWSILRLLFSQ